MKGYDDMKRTLMTAAFAAMAFASQGASLNTVEVNASAITCLFNTNCTNYAEELLTPIAISGTTGTGYVHSRVISGDAGSMAAGHYGYEYSVDLSGIVTDPANPVSLTNVVKCRTGWVDVYTNQLVCRTNIMNSLVVCTTNRTPATNVVTCVTNIIKATNVTQCITNAAGVAVCFTNSFPSVTNVVCFTNRIRASTTVTCQTNSPPGGIPVEVCKTNKYHYRTNLTTCETNITTTPGSPACVKSLRFHIGSVVTRLDLNGDGTNTDNVYVVTSGGSGTVAPSSVEWDDNDLVVYFSPPLCAGDSSFAVGIVGRTAPTTVKASLKMTAGSDRSAKVLAPREPNFECDFEDLAKAIRNLRTRDFTGADDTEREAHRAALLDIVQLASEAGSLDNVAEALAALLQRTDGHGQDWVTSDGRDKIKDEIKALLKCLEKAQDAEDDDDHDHH